jgi:hypothetical protein
MVKSAQAWRGARAWLNRAVSKTAIPSRVSGVQISPPPPRSPLHRTAQDRSRPHQRSVLAVLYWRVLGYLKPPTGGMPQDVRAGPDGRTFFVADMLANGVFVIDGDAFKEIGFVPTGVGAHGLYPSRDGTKLYVANRGSNEIHGPRHSPYGGVSVIDFGTFQQYMQNGRRHDYACHFFCGVLEHAAGEDGPVLARRGHDRLGSMKRTHTKGSGYYFSAGSWMCITRALITSLLS